MRGKENGTDSEVMVDVFRRVLRSGHFAGQAFSYADDEIWRRARGIGSCGNAPMWREWNTAHHIARVVRDLGAISGRSFEDGRVSKVPAEQVSMF